MKLNLKILVIPISFAILSCKQNEKTIETLHNNWEKIEINTRTEKLLISKFSDSAEYEQNPNDIAFKILPEDGKIAKEEIVKKKVYFTKSEKDSLAKYIYESVTKPKFTNALATDYAGRVTLRYDTGNMKLTCEYDSVGDWSLVSEQTKKIYDMISNKIKISKN